MISKVLYMIVCVGGLTVLWFSPNLSLFSLVTCSILLGIAAIANAISQCILKRVVIKRSMTALALITVVLTGFALRVASGEHLFSAYNKVAEMTREIGVGSPREGQQGRKRLCHLVHQVAGGKRSA